MTPCLVSRSPVKVVSTNWWKDLPIDAFSQECINKTLKELQDEQAGVAHLL
jgi:hypothetical protein